MQLEDELRELRISNLHLEDKSRCLQSELIRLKATQQRESDREIARLSQAYATLEQETSELRVRLAAIEPSSTSAVFDTHTLGLLQSEQRLVRQLQQRLALLSDPLDRLLRGDITVQQTCDSLAQLSIADLIDQLKKHLDSDFFEEVLTELARRIPENWAKELLWHLLPSVLERDQITALARKAGQLIPTALSGYLLRQEDWIQSAAACETVEELEWLFRVSDRPGVSLEQEYELIRRFGDYRGLKLIAKVKGGEPIERLCLLRAGVNDALRLMASDVVEAAEVLRELTASVHLVATEIKKDL